MAFRAFNPSGLARFNSATSSNLLSAYENHVSAQLIFDRNQTPHRAIAPSSFRCPRRSWFRLRGTKPDQVTEIDYELEFTARAGTAFHRMIQSDLKDMLGDNWVSVDDWVARQQFDYKYTLTPAEDSLETFVEIEYPPIRFACDGIIFWENKYWLLEIKTIDNILFKALDEPREEHEAQVTCYATYLNLDGVLFMYLDRWYGRIKCYEVDIPEYRKADIRSKVAQLLDLTKSNLVPDPLPKGDKWCSTQYCPYFKTCGEYGR